MNSNILKEKSKCIDCNDRYPACQDHCEYGKALKAARWEKKQRQFEAERGDNLARDRQVNAVYSYKKRTGQYRKRR